MTPGGYRYNARPEVYLANVSVPTVLDVDPRIIVIGVTGAGKSTLANDMATRLGVRDVELDALYWEQNWTAAATDVFRARVVDALQGDRWVASGNYSKARDITWGKANTLVWLDYPIHVAAWRLFWRTIGRIRSNDETWGGNRERWQDHFLSRDSLFLWLLKTHGRYRRTFPEILTEPAYSHLRVVRLRTPKETRAWLEKVTKS